MRSIVQLICLCATLTLQAKDILPITQDSLEAWNLLKESAQTHEQDILLYLSSPNSTKCQDFASHTLDNPIVTSYIKRFTTWASFDSETSLLGEGFTQRYAVDTWPTVIILNSRGQEIGRIIGNHSPSQFIRELNRIRIGGISPHRKTVSETPIQVGFIDTALLQQHSQLLEYFQKDLNQLQNRIGQDVQKRLLQMKEVWNSYQSAIDAGENWTDPIPRNPDSISVQDEVERTLQNASDQLSIQYAQSIGLAAQPIIEKQQLPIVVGPQILLQGDPINVELIDISNEVIPLLDQLLADAPQNQAEVKAPNFSAPTSRILGFSGKQAAQEWLELFKDDALIRAHRGEDINTLLAQIQEAYSIALQITLPRMRELCQVDLVFDNDANTYFCQPSIQSADDTMVQLLMEVAAEFPITSN